MKASQTNWATNISFSPANYHAPVSRAELQAIVAKAKRVKVIGSRHCFNAIADSSGDMISLDRMVKDVFFDTDRQTATVNAGMTYVELAPILHQAGYALPNMASIPHVTVMGACSTATHGSGDAIGNLSTAVSGLEMVTAEGDLVTLSREQDGDRFHAAVVALGSLGVVTRVTLDLMPAFGMQQVVYNQLPMADLEANFDEIMGGAYSVSLFTNWRDRTVNQVWRKHLLPDGRGQQIERSLFGAKAATENRHPVDSSAANPCTMQLGVPGPWYERLPHFHIRSTLAPGSDLQTEYFVDRRDALQALQAVERLQAQMAPILKLTEVRSMAADDLWLSMAYGRDTIGIHFSWYDDLARIAEFLPVLEDVLLPFQARPHWGKLFAMAPERLQTLYPKMAAFQALRRDFDPRGKFRNAYLDKYIL